MKSFYRHLFLALIVCLTELCTYSQKPAIDSAVISGWPTISIPQISNNGQIVLYTVFSSRGEQTLFVRHNDGREIGSFAKAISSTITSDSRKIIIQLPTDTLCIYDPMTRSAVYFGNVSEFKVPEGGTGEWIAWLNKSTDELVVKNLISNTQHSFNNVSAFNFSKSGKIIVVESNTFVGGKKEKKLDWISSENKDGKTIWRGDSVLNINFNRSETKIVFLTSTNDKPNIGNTVWIFSETSDSATKLFSSNSEGIGKSMTIGNGELNFSPNGKRIIFYLSRDPASNPLPDSDSGIVWNYHDAMLKNIKNKALYSNQTRLYLAMYFIEFRKVVQIEKDQDKRWSIILGGEGNSDFAVSILNGNDDEGYLHKSERQSLCLTNLIDGGRSYVEKNADFTALSVSPHDRFLLWYDRYKQRYRVYDIQSRVIRDINAGPAFGLFDKWDVAAVPNPYSVAAWNQTDSAILIYDHYDIWQIDPLDIRAPINLTNGFGKRNGIILRMIDTRIGYSDKPLTIGGEPRIILAAFDELTKENGFFELNTSRLGDPKKLILSSHFYYGNNFRVRSFALPAFPFIAKAKDTNLYLLYKMNAQEFPNLQITQDFSRFVPISNLHPEKQVNWLKTRLLKWSVKKDIMSQGILYLPENFDSSKKYPLIVDLYEMQSDGLNVFIYPDLCRGSLNIPWIVSQGYIVFCPDIKYKIGSPGQSVYDYVITGVNALARKRWIDASKMALCGHSFGGYEVNLLITRSHLFAAAISAAGISDLISAYGAFGPEGLFDYHITVEQQQNRMGTSLWQNPTAYIRNSPIFQADKVTTPLLIMHSVNDTNVPWQQGYEFFTALRRLNKRAWLLEYDGDNVHILINERSAADYTKRLLEFLNYYLKDSSPPIWMQSYVMP